MLNTIDSHVLSVEHGRPIFQSLVNILSLRYMCVTGMFMRVKIIYLTISRFVSMFLWTVSTRSPMRVRRADFEKAPGFPPVKNTIRVACT